MRITSDTELLIDRALLEDTIIGDPTTEVLIPADLKGNAVIVAEANGILAGIDVALAVFERFDATMATKRLIQDGFNISPGSRIAELEGSMSSILTAERTALNFVRKLSGIATDTRKYVDTVSGYTARIVDTRKTTPGLRSLEKYAVRMGGGLNHRQNLGDGILIKDNHIQALQGQGVNISDLIRKAQNKASHTIKIEVEVENIQQAEEALEAGVEILLLDNMSTESMKEAVALCKGRAITEASGGITLSRVKEVASTGVNLISIGALTHSSSAIDIGLTLY